MLIAHYDVDILIQTQLQIQTCTLSSSWPGILTSHNSRRPENPKNMFFLCQSQMVKNICLLMAYIDGGI